MKRALTSTTVVVLSFAFARLASAADTVVQVPMGFPVDTFLEGRTVATLTGGVVVPWGLGAGVDGNGSGNGFMTQAASKSLGQNVKALPDDGKFPADARHPEVVLHFSNDAPATRMQTHPVHGVTNFSFSVPVATYSKMFLWVTSAEGSSALEVHLDYTDGTIGIVNVTVPDNFNDVDPNDPVVLVLYGNMAKWDHDNGVAEQNHHNLDGVEIHPAAGKMISNIDVLPNGDLVFWGATGIATSAVVLPGDGSGGNSGGGGFGSGGGSGGGFGGPCAGGSGCPGGAGGAGGATGGAGATGTAGTSGAGGAAGGATGASGSSAGGASGGGTAGSSGASGSAALGAMSSGGCGCRVSDGAISVAGLSLMFFAFTLQRRHGRR